MPYLKYWNGSAWVTIASEGPTGPTGPTGEQGEVVISGQNGNMAQLLPDGLYVPEFSASSYVLKAGDTMTGQLTIQGSKLHVQGGGLTDSGVALGETESAVDYVNATSRTSELSAYASMKVKSAASLTLQSDNPIKVSKIDGRTVQQVTGLAAPRATSVAGSGADAANKAYVDSRIVVLTSEQYQELVNDNQVKEDVLYCIKANEG